MLLCHAYCCSILVLIYLSSFTVQIECAVTDNTVDDRGPCFEKYLPIYLILVHTETLSLAGAVNSSCMLWSLWLLPAHTGVHRRYGACQWIRKYFIAAVLLDLVSLFWQNLQGFLLKWNLYYCYCLLAVMDITILKLVSLCYEVNNKQYI